MLHKYSLHLSLPKHIHFETYKIVSMVDIILKLEKWIVNWEIMEIMCSLLNYIWNFGYWLVVQ